MYKRCSNLQVRPSTVQKLQSLQQRPSILAHNVGGNDARRPALTSDGVDQDAFSLDNGVVNEVKDLVGRVVLGVEKYLVLLIQPKVTQVLNANCLPMIGDLFPRTIDNMSDLVCNNKLQILH